MAEDTEAASTQITAENTLTVEELPASSEELAPNQETYAPREEQEQVEEEANETAAEPSETSEMAQSASDLKRKLEDLEGEGEKKKDEADLESYKKTGEIEAKISNPDDAVVDAKRQRIDGDVDGPGADVGQEVQKVEAPVVGNGKLPYTESDHSGPVETLRNPTENPTEGVSPRDILPSAGQQDISRKIEVPHNKVGVLIGKAGETIRLLQNNSGARIQITRDAEANPNSSSRPVELTGTLENINKAEQLIKDVIAEADAGGSPALVARGFGAIQSGSEVHEMQVPNEKVGMIIGKGGETIKNLQTRSHARIQLIPQHLPEGDFSKERIVRITGNKKQIEAAKEMIKEVMNQAPGRPSSLSGGHSQSYRMRGPATAPQWGPRAPTPVQAQSQPNTAYDYQQRGTYPPQSTQYPQQSYGSGYPQQPPPRSNLSTGWEQRPAAPVQTPSGYDYYGQGGQAMGTQPSNPAPAPASAPVNYNYGQPQSAYGQSNPYTQSAPPQQSYGHGYSEPKYDNQAPSQQIYSQQPQPVSSQPGFYAQQGSTAPQSGYTQQAPYNKPTPYSGAPQSFGPRATQPGDPMYQGPTPLSYGSGGPNQQAYPYGSSAPSPQPGPAYSQTYGPASGVADGYPQPNSQVAPGYGQSVPAYSQTGAQPGGYVQYPSAQPTYGEQPAANNVNYGYQGVSTDAGYGNSVTSAGYGAAPAVGNQPGYGQVGGYAQPSGNPASYDQSMAPQSGYGNQGSAPVGYAKGVSPQPGGYGQYDSVPMYGHH